MGDDNIPNTIKPKGNSAMSNSTSPTVSALYRYPVKGLSPEALQSVTCTAGETFPCDRIYAIENGPNRFDPANPKHLPKVSYLMLMRDERLATLQTQFDDATDTLTVLRDGKQVARGQLNTPTGRMIIEQFMSAYMNFSLRGAPKVVSAPGHSFSDVPVKVVHIVNLASVRELERATRNTVDPLRFRANIYIDGVEPWEEFKWLDKQIESGAAKFSVIDRTQRCDATNVNPSKGIRDMAIPTALQRHWGHSDFGIYAKISGDGEVRVGDTFTIA